MELNIDKAERLKKLPPYLFAEIDRKKKQMLAAGKDLIDLGVGDPDLPTPKNIIDKLYQAAQDPATHRYPMGRGITKLREAIGKWYKERFKVDLDIESEILPLIGSKEGIAHLPLAFLNYQDLALIPDPSYPPYRSGVILAGGNPYYMPLLEQNNFLPDLTQIDAQVARRAKIMYLNYPNNPTGACANEEFYKNLLDFAKEYNIIVCHDAAYSELAYDGFKPPSLLNIKGAKEIAVEFHSLSKTYNMTGWRIGFVCGNSKVIKALSEVKENIDSGIFEAVQFAGIEALQTSEHLKSLTETYKERRDTLIDGLNSLGWKVPKPKATFYVWVPVPPGCTSMELSSTLLEHTNIVTTPGVGFGENGEGYIRMALTVSKERLAEAVERIKKFHE
jgi:LL-diaminopimelate aminotransferase